MRTLLTLGGLLVLLIGGGIGFPVPEDVTLVGSGLLARTGDVALWQVILVGVAGVCVADWILYLAGRRYGSTVMEHRFTARIVRREHLATVEAFVRRRGAWAVFLARFVFGTRMATFVSAGAFRMPFVTFAVAEGTGTALFVTATVSLGFLFAHRAEEMMADVGHAEHWLVLGGAGAAIVTLVVRSLAARRRAAAPGPP